MSTRAIVDGHLHVFRALTSEYPRAVDDLAPPELEVTVEDYERVMDEHGVEHAVLVPLSPHDEYLREVLSSRGDRFAGIVVHDPEDTDPLKHYLERTRDINVQGLRLFSFGTTAAAAPEELSLFPVLEEMSRRRDKLWYYCTERELPLLSALLEILPDLRVVFNHIGISPENIEADDEGRPHVDSPLPPPALDRVCAIAETHSNTYVMWSGQYAITREAYPFQDLISSSRALFNAFGSSRMMWASDFPWIRANPGYGRLTKLVDAHFPDIADEDRRNIMGDTARRLFGWP